MLLQKIFMLPLSHDEVVHGKRSLLYRMPGDEWQRFANLRLLYGYMFTHPGTKLIFQGAEIGQGEEWNFNESIQWHLLDYDVHKGIQTLIKDLNLFYRKEKALHEKQFSADGFEWIDYNNAEDSILIYMRKGKKDIDDLVVVCNLTPVPRENYRIGLPKSGKNQGSFLIVTSKNIMVQVILKINCWLQKIKNGSSENSLLIFPFHL